MREYFAGFLAVAVVVASATTCGNAQTPSADSGVTKAFANLHEAIAALQPRADDAGWNGTVAKLRTADAKIQSRFNASSNSVSRRYAETINLDARLISSAPVGAAGDKQLAGVADDLSVKVDYAEHAFAASTSLGNDLTVTVKAIDSAGHDKTGYFVFGNALGAPNADPPQVIFSSPTPTKAVALPPGYYVFWLTRGSKHGKQQKRLINNTQDLSQEVTLEADI